MHIATTPAVRPCTFFVEENPLDLHWRPRTFRRPEWLNNMFFGKQLPGQDTVARRLKDNGHSVALGLIDLDVDTAGIVTKLNDTGIPVVAWLLLPEETGYWSNPSNVSMTSERIHRFLAWKDLYGLKFTSLGLDWEIPIQIHMKRNGKKRYPSAVSDYRRFYSKRRIEEVTATLAVAKREGLQTEMYVMPSLLSYFMGLHNQPEVDRRVIMAYSSILGPLKNSKLATRLMCQGYPNASVAYGIVSASDHSSPGRDFADGKLPPHLIAQELATAIKATPASNLRQPSYLFALNGSRVITMWHAANDLAGM